jgi:hypothetical protein
MHDDSGLEGLVVTLVVSGVLPGTPCFNQMYVFFFCRGNLYLVASLTAFNEGNFGGFRIRFVERAVIECSN